MSLSVLFVLFSYLGRKQILGPDNILLTSLAQSHVQWLSWKILTNYHCLQPEKGRGSFYLKLFCPP